MVDAERLAPPDPWRAHAGTLPVPHGRRGGLTRSSPQQSRVGAADEIEAQQEHDPCGGFAGIARRPVLDSGERRCDAIVEEHPGGEQDQAWEVVPIRVDREQRRALLAEAVWRVVARDGMAAASVRGVARETGLSMGSIRHFFGTQDQLLRFAVTELVERVRERIEARAQARTATVGEGRPIDAAAVLLEEVIPLDDQRLLEARVWAAFMAPPVTDQEMAGIRHYADERIGELCRGALEILGGVASCIRIGTWTSRQNAFTRWSTA